MLMTSQPRWCPLQGQCSHIPQWWTLRSPRTVSTACPQWGPAPGTAHADTFQKWRSLRNPREQTHPSVHFVWQRLRLQLIRDCFSTMLLLVVLKEARALHVSLSFLFSRSISLSLCQCIMSITRETSFFVGFVCDSHNKWITSCWRRRQIFENDLAALPSPSTGRMSNCMYSLTVTVPWRSLIECGTTWKWNAKGSSGTTNMFPRPSYIIIIIYCISIIINIFIQISSFATHPHTG